MSSSWAGLGSPRQPVAGAPGGAGTACLAWDIRLQKCGDELDSLSELSRTVWCGGGWRHLEVKSPVLGGQWGATYCPGGALWASGAGPPSGCGVRSCSAAPIRARSFRPFSFRNEFLKCRIGQREAWEPAPPPYSSCSPQMDRGACSPAVRGQVQSAVLCCKVTTRARRCLGAKGKPLTFLGFLICTP